MQISSPPKVACSCALLVVAALLAAPAAALAAQTLARPGWAGSGLTQESWWQDAVFYRIQPRDFQDSDGAGVGDLRGIAQRLDYLQSLGVDAIVLEPPFDEDGFDDLLAEASRRHVRIVIALASEAPADEATTVAKARQWLNRGAAGIDLLPSIDSAGKDTMQDPDWLRALRAVTDTFPGQRVLLAESLPGVLDVSNPAVAPRIFDPHGAQLVDSPVNYWPYAGSSATNIAVNFRNALMAASARRAGLPLLVSDQGFRSATAYAGYNDEARSRGTNLAVATMLLASHGAVSLLYGQELGMLGYPDAILRWTPSNVTRPDAPVETPKPAPPPSEDVYGAYVPYVPPAKKAEPAAGEPAFDPDALPGFSTKATGSDPANGAASNVAVEDHDTDSLLSFYRRLSQLHHGNATLRSGSTYVLDHDAEHALVWVRRAPAGARTVASVIVACNLSDQPVTLSLTRELEHLGIRAGTLRNLLTSDRANAQPQSTDRLVVAPWSIFLGELYHH